MGIIPPYTNSKGTLTPWGAHQQLGLFVQNCVGEILLVGRVGDDGSCYTFCKEAIAWDKHNCYDLKPYPVPLTPETVYVGQWVRDIKRPYLIGQVRHIHGQCHKEYDDNAFYVEPFGGNATVLLSKPRVPVEVYNDLDNRLVNLFRILQNPADLEQLEHRLNMTLYSRSEFRRALQIMRHGPFEGIEYAWAFFTAQNQGFGGIAVSEGNWSRNFGTARGMPAAVSRFLKRVERLKPIHERLKSVQIDSTDALSCIRFWDSPDTVFYCDPPYVHETRSKNRFYLHEQPLSFHVSLVKILSSISGRCVLSCYWNQVYQPLVDAGWQRVEFEVTCRASAVGRGQGQTRTKRNEVLLLKN